MRARCSFNFRELKYRKAGKFKTKAGEEVQYKEAYTLRCDDVTETGDVFEVEFIIPTTETELINKLNKYKYMDKIILELNIHMLKDKRTGYIELIDVVISNDAVTSNKETIDENDSSKLVQKKLF